MRALTLAGLAMLLMSGAGWALWPAAQAQTAATPGETIPARSQLAQSRAEAERARGRAAALDRQARAATLASERATIAAAALAARVEQAEATLAVADAELAGLRAARRSLDRRLASERAPVAQLLAGLQIQVRRPPLLTLFQPGSIEDTVHLRAVLAAVGPQIGARTASLRDSLERARDLERAATQTVARRRALQANLLARRSELAAVSAAERLKARRAAGAAGREAERAFAIAAQTRSLSTLVRRLDEAGEERRAGNGAVQTPAPSPRGSASGPAPYRLPVSGAAGPGRATGQLGVTLTARPGALVVAPGAGRIAFAGPYRGYGAIIIVEHAGGWTSLVTGLGSASVAVGQTVVAGSPIGQAPDAEPEIGLELRRNGQGMNPLDQLR